MAGHYELTESIWALIADFLSVKKQRGGFIKTIGSCQWHFERTVLRSLLA